MASIRRRVTIWSIWLMIQTRKILFPFSLAMENHKIVQLFWQNWEHPIAVGCRTGGSSDILGGVLVKIASSISFPASLTSIDVLFLFISTSQTHRHTQTHSSHTHTHQYTNTECVSKKYWGRSNPYRPRILMISKVFPQLDRAIYFIGNSWLTQTLRWHLTLIIPRFCLIWGSLIPIRVGRMRRTWGRLEFPDGWKRCTGGIEWISRELFRRNWESANVTLTTDYKGHTMSLFRPWTCLAPTSSTQLLASRIWMSSALLSSTGTRVFLVRGSK